MQFYAEMPELVPGSDSDDDETRSEHTIETSTTGESAISTAAIVEIVVAEASIPAVTTLQLTSGGLDGTATVGKDHAIIQLLGKYVLDTERYIQSIYEFEIDDKELCMYELHEAYHKDDSVTNLLSLAEFDAVIQTHFPTIKFREYKKVSGNQSN